MKQLKGHGHEKRIEHNGHGCTTFGSIRNPPGGSNIVHKKGDVGMNKYLAASVSFFRDMMLYT
jgi:hypothetical protein